MTRGTLRPTVRPPVGPETPRVRRADRARAIAETACWSVAGLSLILSGYGLWWTGRAIEVLGRRTVFRDRTLFVVVWYFAGCFLSGLAFCWIAHRLKRRPIWLVPYLGASAVASGYLMGVWAR